MVVKQRRRLSLLNYFTFETNYSIIDIRKEKDMNELIEIILRIIGILLCLGIPAYALLYFDGPEF